MTETKKYIVSGPAIVAIIIAIILTIVALNKAHEEDVAQYKQSLSDAFVMGKMCANYELWREKMKDELPKVDTDTSMVAICKKYKDGIQGEYDGK